MLFHKKTIRDIDLKDKTVLVRADYNVPLENGAVEDDYRIRMSLPTIHDLLNQNCKVVLISHLGRPDGQPDEQFSLRPVATRLSELLETEVKFADDCLGEATKQLIDEAKSGEVILLENLRFHYQEEVNDKPFAQELASLGQIFVQDGFGVVHRAHASTSAITEFLPAVAGELVETEYKALTKAIDKPEQPLVAIIGGSKIKDKIDLINRFIEKAQTIIIGGAMANTFLRAKGLEIGKSIYDDNEVGQAKTILERCQSQAIQVVLPLLDVRVGDKVSSDTKAEQKSTENVTNNDMILGFGDKSIESVIENIKEAGTIIWNGPLGMIELPEFAVGTERVARYIAEFKLNCVVGGGDTAGFIHKLGLVDQFTHVSTGGGASLELMSGQKLPGIEALLDR